MSNNSQRDVTEHKGNEETVIKMKPTNEDTETEINREEVRKTQLAAP
jgi:hypothetical protein